ncbi:MAG: hypothetical protein AAGU78_17335 [Chloroflexota bacterium]|jgi:gas vesicle protein|nr:hypothetical protein [Anaerolineae bacterium]HMM28750.1 hypothetical protein [Aggregatilineaceae bacterium]
MGKRQEEANTGSFLGGLLLGLLVSAPVAAWLSPYSGHRLRQTIRQRGQVIVRRAGETAQQVSHIPARITGGVGQQVGQLQDKVRGRDTLDAALEEGRAIAAQRRSGLPY